MGQGVQVRPQLYLGMNCPNCHDPKDAPQVSMYRMMKLPCSGLCAVSCEITSDMLVH